ncbi:hypothetical protein BH23CHL1_BH23CHL1_05180 [soil metagenome]
MHKRRYNPDDPGGSRKVSGRFHRGLDRFPEAQTWSVLYLSLAAEASLAEILRHSLADIDLLPEMNNYRLSEFFVRLEAVVDCRDTARHGPLVSWFEHPTDYSVSQSFGGAALAVGAEGLLVPSATRLGDNLVIFPTQLRPDSRLDVVSSRDPLLYVERA